MSHHTMWRATMANEREKLRHEQEMHKMWEKIRTTRCHSKREFDKLWKEYSKMLAYAYVYKLHGFTRNDPAREERERLKQENLEMFERCYENHSRTRSNSPVSKRAKTPRTRSESPRVERRPQRQASSEERNNVVKGIKGYDKLFPAIVNKKKDQKPKILGLKGKGVPPPTIRPHSEISLSASKRQAVEINQNFQKVLVDRQNTSVESPRNDISTPGPSDDTFSTENHAEDNISRFPEIPKHWSLVHRSDTLPVDPDTGAIILGHYSDKKQSETDPKTDRAKIDTSSDEKIDENSEKEMTSIVKVNASESNVQENQISLRTNEYKNNGDQDKKEGENYRLQSSATKDSKVTEMESPKSEDASHQGQLEPEWQRSNKNSPSQGMRIELVQKSRTSVISTQIDTSKREENPNKYNKNATDEEPLPVSNTVSLMLASLKQKAMPNRKTHSEPTWKLRYMMKLRQQEPKTNRSLSPIPERPKSIIPHEYNSKVRRRRFLEQEVDRVMHEWDPATHRARGAQKLLQVSREKTQIDITRLKAALVRDFRVSIDGNRPKFPPIHYDRYSKKHF